MEIKQMSVKDIVPYEKNAKKHDETQIKNVMESIKQFGFLLVFGTVGCFF
jgi:hypothetical protein